MILLSIHLKLTISLHHYIYIFVIHIFINMLESKVSAPPPATSRNLETCTNFKSMLKLNPKTIIQRRPLSLCWLCHMHSTWTTGWDSRLCQLMEQLGTFLRHGLFSAVSALAVCAGGSEGSGRPWSWPSENYRGEKLYFIMLWKSIK